MPDVLDTLTAGQPHVLLATVLLGTNDASLPGSVLHVPLQAFASNLAAIVQQLLAAGVLHVVVATPPPIHEAAAMAAHAKSQVRREVAPGSMLGCGGLCCSRLGGA